MRAESTVLLVVCGGIAAYKAVELLRLLQRRGARVRVVMTAAAQRFVGPLTFEALSGAPVGTTMFAPAQNERIEHITLAREADCAVVVPATANFLAKLRWGLADDLPSTVLLAYRGPLVLAPAMNVAMWDHPATQDNVRALAARAGVRLVAPAAGELACHEQGAGRLADIEEIVEGIEAALSPQDLAGRHLVISSGPTREALDPVRFLSNRATGRMGHALALVAVRRGAQVTLVSGPVALAPPPGARLVSVTDARSMHAAVTECCASADCLIMAAAVADVRPAALAAHKLRKAEVGAAPVELRPNPDILLQMGEAGTPRLRVGFAAETEPGLEAAWAKLRRKRCHLLALNRVDLAGQGFGSAANQVTLLDDGGGVQEIPLCSKEQVAGHMLDRIAARLDAGEEAS